MELILVRHGETEWNKLGRCQGVSDVPLNSTGRRQAEDIGRALKEEALSAVYSSDLIRAFETAEEIAKYHSISVQVDNDFREMDQGDFEGLDFDHIRANHSDVLKEWREKPETLRIPGGESLLEVQERAWEAFIDLYKNYENKKIVVVSHNLTIITLLCKFAGKTLASFRDFIVQESSKSVVICNNESYYIDVLNDMTHLQVN